MFYNNKLSNIHKFFILLLFFISGNSLAITEQEVIENIVPSNETLLVSTVQKQASELISVTYDEEKKPDIWIESIAFFLIMQDQKNTDMIDTLLNEKTANNELLQHSESIADKLVESNKNCLEILGLDTRDENVLKLKKTLHNFIMNKMLIKYLCPINYKMLAKLKSVFLNHTNGVPLFLFSGGSPEYNYNSNDVLLFAMMVFLMKYDGGVSLFLDNTGKDFLSTFDWNQPAVNAYRILTIYYTDKKSATEFFHEIYIPWSVTENVDRSNLLSI